MPTDYTPNALTVSNARTADSNLIGQVFNKTILMQSRQKDVFGQMEGPEGSGKPVVVKTDLRAGKGDQVHFTVAKNLGGSVRRGDAILEGYEEQPVKKTFSVRVDQIRHGVAWTELIEELLSVGMSVEEAYATLLGNHFGRIKQDDALISLLRGAGATNTIYANGRANVDALVAADTFDTDVISDATALAISRGAVPANLAKSKSKAEILRYLIFSADRVLRPLKSDDAYLNALRNAGERGDENVLFRGGYADWDGHMIFHWNDVDEDTYGPIGTPLMPRAVLGTAIAAGSSALDIKAPGSDVSSIFEPFKYFPGFAYKLYSSEVIAADTEVYYVVIYNLTGAAAGKYGVYRYTGSSNNGNKITIDKRLGNVPGDVGVVTNTLAGKTWDSSKHTDAHPAGSLVIPVNAACVPIGDAFVFGAGALCRAYGSVPMRRIRDTRDFGERKGMGYKSIFGQSPTKDTDGLPRNFVRIRCAVEHQGVTIT